MTKTGFALLTASLLVLFTLPIAGSPGGAARGPLGASLVEVAQLRASDGQAGDIFQVVAIDGDTAVVGAGNHRHGGVSSGAAYVFERDLGGPDAWGEVVELIGSDSRSGDQFGVSTTVFGDTIVVGARWHDDLGSNSGSAYVFERDAGGSGLWGEVAELYASDTAGGDEFGARVVLDGDTLLVTAIGNDDDGFNSGSAYIFERDELDPHVWIETAKLTASDAQASSLFGWGASISGDTVVVGSIHHQGNTGAAYVFERDAGGPGAWGQVARLQPPDLSAGDYFGVAKVDGDTIVVGANHHHTPIPDSGAAYVFRRDAGGAGMWGQVAKLMASDGAPSDTFGSGNSVDGDRILIGSPSDDDVGAASGSVYLFERDPGGSDSWEEVAKTTASDGGAGDWFGAIVALDGDTALVGAPFADTLGSDSGSAYVFEIRSGLSIAITGTCPGELTISVTTPDPDQSVILFAGPGEGTSYVPWGRCAGTELDLEFARKWRAVTTDADGLFSITRMFSSAYCGRFVQVLDRSCATSNVAGFP